MKRVHPLSDDEFDDCVCVFNPGLRLGVRMVVDLYGKQLPIHQRGIVDW